MDNRVRAWLAELIGTFAVVFFVAGTVCAVRFPTLTCQTYTDVIAVALASSFALSVYLPFMVNITDRRAPRLGGLGAGLMQAVIVLTGFYLTGGSANPARWFGTVIWEYTSISLRDLAFADHPVYWMGPIVGALFASAIYVKLIL